MKQFNNYRPFIYGLDMEVPLEDGSFKEEINFDNAATTPPLNNVVTEILSFCSMYSSTHRGTGYKSRYTSYIYDRAREVIAEFVGTNLEKHTIIFCSNTTEAINKLANDLDNSNGRNIIISSTMEHHSNDLPWRKRFDVKYIDIDKHGRLDLNSLEALLCRYKNRVRLVTVTGISNVTGYVNDIHKIARMCHKHNTEIAIDAAQMIAHMSINMNPTDEDSSIDYLFFSAHKMYAPFGTGVLIAPTKSLTLNTPERTGGGTVSVVTHDYVIWAHLPNKEEAGSPNTVGSTALLTAIKTLTSIGLDNIHNLEKDLTCYAFSRLKRVPNIILYGDIKDISDRVGIIPFNIKGVYHEDLAYMLSSHAGIAVRNGCFCAHPYLHKLLNVSKEVIARRIDDINAPYPGMVRLSFGLYNTKEEIDELVDFLISFQKDLSRNINMVKRLKDNPTYNKKTKYITSF